MRALQIVKKNKLPVIVGIIYILLYILVPNKADTSMRSSIYYLIEMFEVLPVIFLLTIALEVLVPKEWIMKHFGEKSGFLGNILSFILGSISAGPIYAAFPISKMLLSKGASVPNIVIILSSWAVIKVPMLANEAKFLGISFMGIRWILTVMAIMLMAWVTGKILSRKELLSGISTTAKPNFYVNQDYCIGCGMCTTMLPDVYEIINNKALVRLSVAHPENKMMILKTVEKCPTKAIIMATEVS
ncbi:MAG: permease [Firmicutes bacterium HGW-Firmicutes-3]|jgi:uncharacterized membrane protein YraQ (UPF0718 family)|nr:MAG: permease [Firmicutes bacterium HGW-Firmicutes-3]